MNKTRKYPAADEKAIVLKRYLVERVPMSDLCDEYGLQPARAYKLDQLRRFMKRGRRGTVGKETVQRRWFHRKGLVGRLRRRAGRSSATTDDRPAAQQNDDTPRA